MALEGTGGIFSSLPTYLSTILNPLLIDELCCISGFASELLVFSAAAILPPSEAGLKFYFSSFFSSFMVAPKKALVTESIESSSL